MLGQEHLGVGSLYSLPPDFVRHENEESHEHAYNLGDDLPEDKSWCKEIAHKLGN